MRKNNNFKDEHLVLGNISNASLMKGVCIRPYVCGVLLEVEKSYSGISVNIQGEERAINHPFVDKLMDELNSRLVIGRYLFLWHHPTDVGSKCPDAKKALFGRGSHAGYVLSPLKFNGATKELITDMRITDYPSGKSGKHKLLKYRRVTSQKQYTRVIAELYKKGYGSCVIRVGKKTYRISKVEEEEFKIVGVSDSTRYREVGAVQVFVPELNGPQEIKRGLSVHDKRDLYHNPDEYVGEMAVIQHEGLTSKGKLKNPKIRALRVSHPEIEEGKYA